MTLMPRKLIAQQGSDAKVPAEDLRLALASLFSPGVGANVARTGIIRGSNATGFTACQVIAASASTFTVKQGAFIVQQATTNGGAYIGIVDTDQTVSIAGNLPTSGNFKAGYVLVHCYDEAYGDTQDGFAIEFVLGTSATSAATAVYPTVPTNALALRGFTVDATGAITLTTQPLYTGSHNGILPVTTGDTGAGIYDGQWRDEPDKGLQRWSTASSSWSRPQGNYLGAGAGAFPGASTRPTPTPSTGDTFARSDVGSGGTMFVLTTYGWRAIGPIVVADASGRDGLLTIGPNGTGSGTVLTPGDRVATTAGESWVYTGTSWSYSSRTLVALTATGTWNVASTSTSPLSTTYRVPFTSTAPSNPTLFSVAGPTMTCVQAGWYLLSGKIFVSTNSSATVGGLRGITVYINGAASKVDGGNQFPPNTHSYALFIPPMPMQLSAGDTVDLRMLQDSGVTQPVNLDNSYLFAQFLTNG